jgi:hypothetical protein
LTVVELELHGDGMFVVPKLAFIAEIDCKKVLPVTSRLIAFVEGSLVQLSTLYLN